MDTKYFDPPTDLVELLLQQVPEFGETVEQEREAWPGRSLGPDATFSLLASFVLGRLRSKESNGESLIRRVFDLLEKFASSDDDDKLSVIDVSFGETFLDDPNALGLSEKYLGPKLKGRLERVQKVFKKPRTKRRFWWHRNRD